jgi:hypothetical protein
MKMRALNQASSVSLPLFQRKKHLPNGFLTIFALKNPLGSSKEG